MASTALSWTGDKTGHYSTLPRMARKASRLLTNLSTTAASSALAAGALPIKAAATAAAATAALGLGALVGLAAVVITAANLTGVVMSSTIGDSPMQPAKEPAMEPAHAEAQHLVYQPDFDSDIDGEDTDREYFISRFRFEEKWWSRRRGHFFKVVAHLPPTGDVWNKVSKAHFPQAVTHQHLPVQPMATKEACYDVLQPMPVFEVHASVPQMGEALVMPPPSGAGGMLSTLAGAAAAALGFSLGAAVFSAAAVMTLTDIAVSALAAFGQFSFIQAPTGTAAPIVLPAVTCPVRPVPAAPTTMGSMGGVTEDGDTIGKQARSESVEHAQPAETCDVTNAKKINKTKKKGKGNRGRGRRPRH